MLVVLIVVLTLAGLASLNALLGGAGIWRRSAVIVSFLAFLAWSWVMAYFIATKQ